METPQVSNPHQATAPEPAPTSGSGPSSRRKPLAPGFLAWWTKEKIIIAVLAVLFLINWWDTRRQISNLSEEVAQRLKLEGESLRQQAQAAREAQERVKDALTKVGALEAKIAESQSQQAALEGLYQDLSRNRDDWALTEIEQTLTIASQQLQLAGNVRGALIALQNADQRLGRADKAQFIGVRRALQKDIERLKNLPFIDTSGLAIRLDTVIGGIDTLPLVFDERLPAPRSGGAIVTGAKADGKDGAAVSAGSAATAKTESSAWQRLRDDAWEQFKQLVRIRDIGDADPALLNPSQSYFVRENLKLKLLNARIALLQRNEALFKSDIDGAVVWLNRYADVRSKAGGNALASLRSLSSSAVAIELPTLAESLNAVRNYKLPPRPAGK
jgi:uroporphyrin-III C-methyltransferase